MFCCIYSSHYFCVPLLQFDIIRYSSLLTRKCTKSSMDSQNRSRNFYSWLKKYSHSHYVTVIIIICYSTPNCQPSIVPQCVSICYIHICYLYYYYYRYVLSGITLKIFNKWCLITFLRGGYNMKDAKRRQFHFFFCSSPWGNNYKKKSFPTADVRLLSVKLKQSKC